MNDYLLNLKKNKWTGQLFDTLGLSGSLPPTLARREGPFAPQPFENKSVHVHLGEDNSGVPEHMLGHLIKGGASVTIEETDASIPERFAGNPDFSVVSDFTDVDSQIDMLIFDGIEHEGFDSFDELYEFLRPQLKQMNSSGRILFMAEPDEQITGEQRIFSQGLEGVIRSLAQEVGPFGTTANLLRVPASSRQHLGSVLRFFGSERSAYVSGQTLRVGEHLDTDHDVDWSSSLVGQTAVVTGAARGIGRTIAKQLADEGADIVAVDRPGADLSEVTAETDGEPFFVDVSNDDAPEALCEKAEQLGGIDILVHNAGITKDRSLANMTSDTWSSVIDVNLKGPVRITEALLEADRINDDGRIICMSSVSGIAGNRGQSNYAASKAGLIGYIKDLDRRFAGEQLAANAVAPGFIETEMTAEIPFAIREIARRLNAFNQGGRPQDVADAVTFLALPDSGVVSGEVLRVCGGSILGA